MAVAVGTQALVASAGSAYEAEAAEGAVPGSGRRPALAPVASVALAA